MMENSQSKIKDGDFLVALFSGNLQQFAIENCQQVDLPMLPSGEHTKSY